MYTMFLGNTTDVKCGVPYLICVLLSLCPADGGGDLKFESTKIQQRGPY